MKILESQSAVLTNYEVYTHLFNQKAKHDRKGQKRRRPGNLETIVKELLDYFHEAPSPLASKPFSYNEQTIYILLDRLRPYELAKAEILMIMNLRPTRPESLSTVIQDFEERFPDEQTQIDIANIVQDVLGAPDGAAERQAMTDNAKARKEQSEFDV
ncbi:hypothetical protein B7463_g7241, partial [Scytalidium lignicola]